MVGFRDNLTNQFVNNHEIKACTADVHHTLLVQENIVQSLLYKYRPTQGQALKLVPEKGKHIRNEFK